ncbi:hypothetical protein OKW39_008694 [Paraburkholderia sp. MM6662-R1]
MTGHWSVTEHSVVRIIQAIELVPGATVVISMRRLSACE